MKQIDFLVIHCVLHTFTEVFHVRTRSVISWTLRIYQMFFFSTLLCRNIRITQLNKVNCKYFGVIQNYVYLYLVL